MEAENEIRHAFDVKDLRESDVLIYSVSYVGNGYGRDATGQNPGAIFFHQSLTERFDMKPGDTFRVRYVPNYPDRRQDVPWRAIYVFSVQDAMPEAPRPEVQVKPSIGTVELKARIEELVLGGQVWTMREVFYSIFKRDVDYKDGADKLASATIGNHLRALCKAEKLHRIELYRHGVEVAHAVYFSADLEALKPEGY
jgi:hypothetical protein